MRSGSFSYVAEAPASPEAAMALLGDLTRQGELHPLIVAVEERPAPAGALASFRITDRLRWVRSRSGSSTWPTCSSAPTARST